MIAAREFVILTSISRYFALSQLSTMMSLGFQPSESSPPSSGLRQGISKLVVAQIARWATSTHYHVVACFVTPLPMPEGALLRGLDDTLAHPPANSSSAFG